MKKLFFALVTVFVIIVVCNLPPFRILFGGYDCQFSNGDGSFTYAEMIFKMSDFSRCERMFADFKSEKLGDTVLYRLCPMSVLHFWDYGFYLFSKKYRVPYKDWGEIEARRKPGGKRTIFQDF
ncbi:MAG TPA: hypothetical protein VGN00_30020 [Puia sp.]|jgi:hypothetical protein